MRSFVSSLLLVAGVSSGAIAQTIRIPLEIEEQVVRELATLWGVSPDDLELEWVAERGLDGAPLSATTPFRLVGSDRLGSYTVVFDPGRLSGVRSARFRAGVWTLVPVAQRTLFPGDTLREGDFAYERRLHWGFPGAASLPEPEIGWTVQNVVRVGDVISGHTVRPPVIIRAGELVEVLAERGSVRVELKGTAIKDARSGEDLLVKLEGDRGYVRGKAKRKGLVIIEER